MMTDVFVEYMVKKKTGSKDVLMSLGVSILGAILIFVSIFLTPVSPMIPFLVMATLFSYFGLARRKWQQGEDND